MENKGMTRFFMIMFGIMAISLVVISLWESVPVIKNSVNAILNPTVGALIDWNLTLGSLISFFIISLISTIIQKYATDQETIRELRKEQKELQKELQKYKEDPKKMMEIQKSLMPMTFKILQISMKSSIFTIIPFLLLFKWFMDLFIALGSPKFFGFLSGFWFYFISLVFFGGILRKVLKVA